MVDLTKDNFEEEVLKAEGTVLVDFYGDGWLVTGSPLAAHY